MEVARPKSDRRMLDNINGFTLSVRLSLEFHGLTAQTINEFAQMQNVINTFIPMSAEPRLVAGVTSMFLM